MTSGATFRLRAPSWRDRIVYGMVALLAFISWRLHEQSSALDAQLQRAERSIVQIETFAASDCAFQAIRTPNAASFLLKEADRARKRARIERASARWWRIRGGSDAFHAKTWDTLARDDETLDSENRKYVTAMLRGVYLAGCGPVPTPAPNLRYVTSPTSGSSR